jgi:hypothetical protein
MHRSFLAAAAIGLTPALAPAQTADALLDGSPAHPITLNAIRGGGFTRTGGYSPRSHLDVFDVGIPSESGGAWFSSGPNVYDDVTFGPAYPGNASPLTINSVALGFNVPSTAQAGDDHLYTRLSFYPDHDNSVTAPSTPYSGTPVTWTLDWGAGYSNAWPLTYFNEPVLFTSHVTLDASNVFTTGPDDRTCGVKIELFLDAALSRPANDWLILRRGTGGFSNTPTLTLITGASDLYAWFSPLTVSSPDITNSQRTGGTETNRRATYLALRATGLCGTADFDRDGDLGTDADIEAFFACLAGNCCGSCHADFDGDGDLGTDADIEAFFRVLAGNPC